MHKHDLIKFIKFGIKNKWANLTDAEIEAVISEYIYVKEVHVGDELAPAIRHAITHEDIEQGRAESLLEWGEKNLHDTEFWSKVSGAVSDFKPKSGIGILVLILHFGNRNDAALFALCWK